MFKDKAGFYLANLNGFEQVLSQARFNYKVRVNSWSLDIGDGIGEIIQWRTVSIHSLLLPAVIFPDPMLYVHSHKVWNVFTQ